jgi:hypothetical protein
MRKPSSFTPRAARLAAAAAALLALAAACAGDRNARSGRQSRDDVEAAAFYERSVAELAKGEYVAALADVHRAQSLCREKDLQARVARHKALILNHVQVFAAVEEPATLKYTVLYAEGEVYHPMPGLEVRFGFLEGEGILSSSGVTDSYGTSRVVVEKITSFGRKIVVEAAPAVRLREGPSEIGELKREFVFSKKRAVWGGEESGEGGVAEVIRIILEEMFKWKVE